MAEMKMKIRRGFTLAEILISVAILGVVMGAVLTLFYSVFESYQFHQDITEAKQNGQNALASIQPYISPAALGIPNSKTAFQDAFDAHGSIKKANALLPDPEAAENRFTVPVQVAKEGKPVTTATVDDIFTGNELWLVYAVPSGFGVKQDYEIGATSTVVELSDSPGTDRLEEDTNGLKSWVAFSGSQYPMFVQEIDGKNILLAARTEQKVAAYDEMLHVRAVKIAKNDKDELTVAHLADGIAQNEPPGPVSQGIADARFEFDDDNRVLKVTFLARGMERRNKEYMSEIPGWDGPMPDDMFYRYATVTRSWRIRN